MLLTALLRHVLGVKIACLVLVLVLSRIFLHRPYSFTGFWSRDELSVGLFALGSGPFHEVVAVEGLVEVVTGVRAVDLCCVVGGEESLGAGETVRMMF